MRQLLFTTLLFAILIVVPAQPLNAQTHPPAGATDPYVGLKDPITGKDCCHGVHCRPVVDADDVYRTAEGYMVKTKFGPGGWLFVPFQRVIWRDVDGSGRFHKCEDAAAFLCFIAPPGLGS